MTSQPDEPAASDEPVVEPEPDVAGDDDALEHPHHHLLERLRGTGVGIEDPNIIGDAGPTDVAPGADLPPLPLEEPLPPEVPFG